MQLIGPAEVTDVQSQMYDVLIVGSGAGGATVARELAKRGKKTAVIEKGTYAKKLGSFRHTLPYFDVNTITKTPKKSKEGVILWRTLMAGGSTIVSCGNGTRCLEEELADLGVSLDSEYSEAEKEMHVAPIDEGLLSEGSRRIREASQALGYRMEPMPKFIDAARCKKCGQCVFGCPNDAKWTATRYLDEAVAAGADVLYGTTIERVLIENGRAQGVQGTGPKGVSVELRGDVVVLAAGGLASPVILQQSGIEDAGRDLFMDLLVNTYGVAEGVNMLGEPPMALVDHEFYEDKGFILSPYVNHHRLVRFMELGAKGLTMPANALLGIMTKSKDDSAGRVLPDGSVSKPVTDADWARLREGSSISTEILVKAGARRDSIAVSGPQGAHPGGTAAIGKIVDENLQTRVANLFVCDGSVLPVAPGMPPILTIAALGKRLAKHLAA